MCSRMHDYGMIVMLACYSCPPGWLFIVPECSLFITVEKSDKATCMHVTHVYYDKMRLKQEFVYNFACGYSDINPLSNLKVLICHTIKRSSFELPLCRQGTNEMFWKSQHFSHIHQKLEKKNGLMCILKNINTQSYHIYNA